MPDNQLPPLEPVPATRDAFRFLARGEEDGLEDQVRVLADRVRAVVPEAVGVSLSLAEPEVTFTLVVGDRALLPLDDVPEADTGSARDRLPAPTADRLDEESWSSFARATAHRGVRSTLSVPVHVDRRVVGGLTVYAAAEGAFEGRADDVAELVSSRGSEAVRDADLPFASRGHAEQTLREVEHRVVVDLAAGVLAEREGLPVEAAVARLEAAAVEAGVPVEVLAELLLELRDDG